MVTIKRLREFVSQGIFVDADGNICEGANMNVAILTQQGELLVRVSRLSFMHLSLLVIVHGRLIGFRALQHATQRQNHHVSVQIPPFTNSLAGVTAKRLMELIPQVSILQMHKFQALTGLPPGKASGGMRHQYDHHLSDEPLWH